MVNMKTDEEKAAIIERLKSAVANREAYFKKLQQPPPKRPDYSKGPMQV